MKKRMTLLVWFILLCPLVYLAIIWSRLPPTLPMHFNLQGEVDRYGTKTEFMGFVLFLTALNIGVYYLVINAHRLGPNKKYANENRSVIAKLAVGISIFLCAITLYSMFSIHTLKNGITAFGGKFAFVTVGLLYCLIGNYMYNIKPNSMVGIRIPSTLNSEYNWKRTHRFAAKIWFVGGLLMALLCLVLPYSQAFVAFVIFTALLTIVPVLFSLVLKNHNHLN
ncbi:MAG: SdpI family protein [Chitinophagaceae bacterium]|nr:SdpI family protein [Chitinophagaceae bacterium]